MSQTSELAVGDIVYVTLHKQNGEIIKIRQDDSGHEIFTIVLEEDGVRVNCRLFELLQF